MLDVSPSGTMIGRSQIEDYCLRGAALEVMSFMTFIIETYEESIKDNSNTLDELTEWNEVTQSHGHPRNF